MTVCKDYTRQHTHSLGSGSHHRLTHSSDMLQEVTTSGHLALLQGWKVLTLEHGLSLIKGKLLCLAALPEAWGRGSHCSVPSRTSARVRSLQEERTWHGRLSHQHFAGLTLVQQSAGAETLPQQKNK